MAFAFQYFSPVSLGGADIRTLAYLPGFLGMADRPDLHRLASGTMGVQRGFTVQPVEFGRKVFPAYDYVFLFEFDPCHFGDIFKVPQVFLKKTLEVSGKDLSAPGNGQYKQQKNNCRFFHFSGTRKRI